MHSTTDQPTYADAADVLRRDRALRLRKRILIAAATSSTVAVGGFAVLAEHTAAGTATPTATDSTTGSGTSAARFTRGSGVSSATDSGTSSQSGSSPTPAPTASPVTSGGSHAVSGGS